MYHLTIVLVILCGNYIIEEDIKKIIKSKIINKINNNHKNFKRNKCVIKTNIYSYKGKNKKTDNKRQNKKKMTMSNPRKKSKNFSYKANKERETNHISSSKINLKNTFTFKMEKNKLERLGIIKYDKKKNKIIKEKSLEKIFYKDSELNLLPYQKALKYDKRTFFKYYMSLLFYKNPILFSFYPIIDYNIKIIKISIFVISFDIYFAVNTFFINHSTFF